MGQLSKQEAVRKCLDTMRECFVTCNREASKLDDSMSKYFNVLGNADVNGDSHYHTVAPHLSACGVCKNRMDLRVEGTLNARGVVEPKDGATRFLYCTTCVKSYIVPVKGELTDHELNCALCGFQVLNCKNVGTAKSHTICPHCFSNPPPPPYGVESSADFRCFMCAKEDCELSGRLAGSDIDISPCSDGRCDGQMRLKKGGKGTGLLVGCSVGSACKSSWWLPKFVRSAIPTQPCQRCQQNHGVSVRKLQFSFIMSKAPPFVDPECTLCPSCDPLWSRLDFPGLPLRKIHQPQQQRLAPVFTAGRSATAPVVQATSRNDNNSSRPTMDLPMCQCGLPSVYLVTKAGPNSGRAFFACSKSKETKCKFFEWVDEAGQRTNVSAAVRSTSTGIQSNSNVPNCLCGIASLQFTVSKEGPNKGRKFYSCPKKSGEGKCTFFEWAS